MSNSNTKDVGKLDWESIVEHSFSNDERLMRLFGTSNSAYSVNC